MSFLIETYEETMRQLLQGIDSVTQLARSTNRPDILPAKLMMRPLFFVTFERAVRTRPVNRRDKKVSATVGDWERVFGIITGVNKDQKPDFIIYGRGGGIILLPKSYTVEENFTDEDWTVAFTTGQLPDKNKKRE